MNKPGVNEAAQYFESIFAVAHDAIVFVDQAGIILRVNPIFTKIFGYQEHEILGKPFYILEYKDEVMQKNTSQQPLVNFYKTKNSNLEMTLFDKQGRNVSVRFRSAFIKDIHGHDAQIIGMIERMPEQKDTDNVGDSLAEKMWEAQQNFDNVLNNSADAIAICEISGNIIMANKSFSEMLDYTQEELIGKHVVEFTAYLEGTYPTTTGEEVTIDEESVAYNASRPAEVYEKGYVSNWEFYMVRKDKVHVPVEATLSLLKDKDGDRRGLVIIGREITERKKAEKEISEARDFLENIFKTTADGILVTDNKGIITAANDATVNMLGYSKEEIIGKGGNIFEPEGEEYDIVSSEYVAKLLKEGTVTGFEFVWLKKDGNLINVEVNAALLKDYKGTVTGSVTSIRDITDRKQQEEKLKKAYDEMEVRVDERTAELKESNEQLQQEICVREEMGQKLIEAKEIAESANRAKSEFLANMSHEFRTPLNHIIGFTELVVNKNFGDLNENQEEYLGDALQSSKHLLLLVNDILDLSKVEAGKLELEAADIDPRTLIDNSLIMFKEKSFKHSIELTSDVDHVPETIIADERKLKQILYNLLSNGVKFTPDGGKVCLTAKMIDCIVRPRLRSGDPGNLEIITGENGRDEVNGKKHRKCVKFSISDTGIGIKPEDQDRIFSSFEQVDGSSSRRHQGTGLGLSLTQKLVELHGGRMWVESEGEGHGSTFSFMIPV